MATPADGTPTSASVGGDKERLAADYLTRRGLRLVARNHRCRKGEIDLVMRDGSTLVFVEVRFRASERFGTAAETVDRRKQRRLISAAYHYLGAQGTVVPCRFDVVAISGANRIDWIKDAFSADV